MEEEEEEEERSAISKMYYLEFVRSVVRGMRLPRSRPQSQINED